MSSVLNSRFLKSNLRQLNKTKMITQDINIINLIQYTLKESTCVFIPTGLKCSRKMRTVAYQTYLNDYNNTIDPENYSEYKIPYHKNVYTRIIEQFPYAFCWPSWEEVTQTVLLNQRYIYGYFLALKNPINICLHQARSLSHVFTNENTKLVLMTGGFKETLNFQKANKIINSPMKQYQSCSEGLISIWGEKSYTYRIWSTNEEVLKEENANLVNETINVYYNDLQIRLPNLENKFKTNSNISIVSKIISQTEDIMTNEKNLAYYKGIKLLFPLPPEIVTLKLFPSEKKNVNSLKILIENPCQNLSSYNNYDIVYTGTRIDNFSKNMLYPLLVNHVKPEKYKKNVKNKSKKSCTIRRYSHNINESAQRNTIPFFSTLLPRNKRSILEVRF